ncbi:16S rRNA (cytidine(1402)-2'-O)-methyltransferase [Aerococcaceae bacterium DSM 111176]|nr:16S rRNA (cytidine(1402)-2'-O)-methyltransferase [Aerococcaceae bacterium DSM 111176]
MQKQRSFQQDALHEFGKLYLIPTPIGNLEDMTYRAVRLLGEVDLLLAEDTRHTIKLLNHFGINTKMQSFHEHSNLHEIDNYIEKLQQGQSIGLVSDAGMPLINDPGHPLVTRVLDADIPVVSLPGANAALTALIASGLSAERFTYYGFFPRDKKEQQNILELIGNHDETALFYESPYRIKQAIQAVIKHLGQEREVVIARELTKSYEEYLRGQALELLTYLEENQLKGEIVLLIEGGGLKTLANFDHLTYKQHVELLMSSQGLIPKEAIKQVAKLRSVKKQEVYNAFHEL